MSLACVFLIDRIIIKFAGTEERHKGLEEFYFGPNLTTHFSYLSF